MIDYISFDLGVVFFKPGTQDRFYQKMEDDYGVSPAMTEKACMENWELWNRGKMSLAEYWRAFNRMLGIETDTEELTDFLFNKDAPDEEVVDMVQRLKKRYGVGALTNVPKEWFEYHVAKHGVRLLFDHIVASCYNGVLKPEQESYLELARCACRAPREMVHIDDVEDYVRGARDVGMQAIHYTNNKHLEQALRDLGLEF